MLLSVICGLASTVLGKSITIPKTFHDHSHTPSSYKYAVCHLFTRCGSSEKDFSISLYPPEAGLAIRAIDDVPIIQSKWWINIKSGLVGFSSFYV